MRMLPLYLVLVGIPMIGVLVTLHLGNQLDPSPAFGGAWRLAITTPTEAAACRPPQGILRVEQSGRRARVRFGGSEAPAVVESTGFRTREPLAAGAPGCSGWHVEANAEELVPERVTGRLVAVACACAPVSFTAEREAEAPP